MPSPTFFNLNKEKQDKIIDAALNEFAKENIGEASINQIVKEANISRGSFYTYFTDKYELVHYLIDLVKDILLEKIEFKFKLSNKNLHEMMIIVHDEIYLLLENKRYKAFIQNISLFFHDDLLRNKELVPKELNYDFKLMMHYVNRSQLQDNSDEYLFKVLMVAQSVLKETLLNTIIQKCTLEESRRRFNEFLLLIEQGYGRK